MTRQLFLYCTLLERCNFLSLFNIRSTNSIHSIGTFWNNYRTKISTFANKYFLAILLLCKWSIANSYVDLCIARSVPKIQRKYKRNSFYKWIKKEEANFHGVWVLLRTTVMSRARSFQGRKSPKIHKATIVTIAGRILNIPSFSQNCCHNTAKRCISIYIMSSKYRNVGGKLSNPTEKLAKYVVAHSAWMKLFLDFKLFGLVDDLTGMTSVLNFPPALSPAG